MNLLQLLDAAYLRTIQQVDPGDKKTGVWVRELSGLFRERFSPNQDIRVFSVDFAGNKDIFDRNEYLFDVHVCEIARADGFPYLKKSIWQVESEVPNRRVRPDVLEDFGKLTAGNAENKLMIGPRVEDESRLLQPLARAASTCSGAIFLGLIPPRPRWNHQPMDPPIRLWKFSNANWNIADDGGPIIGPV